MSTTQKALSYHFPFSVMTCRSVLDKLLTQVERNVEKDRRKEKKKKEREAVQKRRQELANIFKLKQVLEDRKERLKAQILSKREILERKLTQDIEKEIAEDQIRNGKRKSEEIDEIPKKKKKVDEKLYCICKTPYDDSK